MDLFPLGLTETLRAYREGRATVQDYVASCSARIAQLEPGIQAWEWFDAQRAMADAEERAGRLLERLGRGGGGGLRTGRDRHSDPWLGHPACGVLRRGGLQAQLRRHL